MAYTKEQVHEMDYKKLLKQFRTYAATVALNELEYDNADEDQQRYMEDTAKSTEILETEILTRLSPEYPYPVWGTQGGGLARRVGDEYVFVETPDCPPLDIGDVVPHEWSLAPANDLAREQSQNDRFPKD